MTKILIADDHELIRKGLRTLLDEHRDFEVIAECTTASEVLQTIGNTDCDILILDVNLPDSSGLDVLKDISIRAPKLKILMFTMHPEGRLAVRAIKLGASGYLTKTGASEELIRALVRISKGGRYITEELADNLAEAVGSPEREIPHDSLSDREFQILLLIGEGESARQITKSLSLSLSSVNTYRKRILQKLNLKTNSELIRYALKSNLVD
jgi:DNA-binding NarL/FixJ family response regulator